MTIFGLPEFFAEVPSRILVRTSDRGMFNDSIDLTSGRDNADKDPSQGITCCSHTLNINVPLNVYVGDIVKVILPNVHLTQTQESKLMKIVVITSLRI